MFVDTQNKHTFTPHRISIHLHISGKSPSSLCWYMSEIWMSLFKKTPVFCNFLCWDINYLSWTVLFPRKIISWYLLKYLITASKSSLTIVKNRKDTWCISMLFHSYLKRNTRAAGLVLVLLFLSALLGLWTSTLASTGALPVRSHLQIVQNASDEICVYMTFSKQTLLISYALLYIFQL